MSYVRFGQEDSDVYVYADTTGFTCAACTHCEGRTQLIAHLTKHIDDADNVPYGVIERLTLELKEYGEQGFKKSGRKKALKREA